MPVEGTPLRPGNCADCGDALQTARQTYCAECADLRRWRSNAEADRRRRQADRDRRTRPAVATADGGVVLPPASVRLLALQVTALREAVTTWRENTDLIHDLHSQDDPGVDLDQAHDRDLELTEAAATAAVRFLAAVDNLLPSAALGR